jgi:hypothetical protein
MQTNPLFGAASARGSMAQYKQVNGNNERRGMDHYKARLRA